MRRRSSGGRFCSAPSSRRGRSESAGRATPGARGERWAIDAERGAHTARLAGVAALGVAGLAVSALVVALATASIGGGLVWTMLGAAAVVGVLAVVRSARS